MQTSLPGEIFWYSSQTIKNFGYATTQVKSVIVWPGTAKFLENIQLSCDWTQHDVKDKAHKIARRHEWSEDRAQLDQVHTCGLGDLKRDQVDSKRAPTLDHVKIFAQSTLNQSPTRSSSASTLVHREECSPPYRQVHKVRKIRYSTESGHPLWQSVVRTPAESRDHIRNIVIVTPSQGWGGEVSWSRSWETSSSSCVRNAMTIWEVLDPIEEDKSA